jgi:hypothetical protein
MNEAGHPGSSIILYQTVDGQTRVQCRFENETIWLTQGQIAELSQHDLRLKNPPGKGQTAYFDELSNQRFAPVHNKMPWAVHGHTAAEDAELFDVRTSHVG